MSLDLTGALIVSFLLDELRPVFAMHPRYRDNAGETFQTFSNLLQFRDVSVTVGNLRGDTARLSPDFYLGTAWARVTAAQVNGKPGSFIEWLQEIDSSKQTPAAGTYLLAVDAVDEATRKIRFIYTTSRTLTGSVTGADGTVICFRPEIPLALVQPTDPTVQLTRAGTKLWLNRYVSSIEFVRSDTGATLAPGVDWWLERTVTMALGTTTGGTQYLLRPDGISNMAVLDGSGSALVSGSDWSNTGDGRIHLAPWTPAGQVYSARGTMRIDPRTNPLIHPENIISLALNPGETLTSSSVSFQTPYGDYSYDDLVTDSGGSLVLQDLLTPGDDLSWEAYTATPQVYLTASKSAMTTDLVPGLNIAIGDLVEAGDQCCILVNQTEAEAYKIYGGKDNLTFDLTIKTNDLTTSSELANMAKGHLLVKGRNRMEAAGITVFSAAYAYGGEQRDASGTAVSHPVVLSISLSADWEFYEPIISSLSAISLDLKVTQGKVRSMTAVGQRTQFISSYF